MLRTTGPVAARPPRQHRPGVAGLVFLSSLAVAPLQAQDWMGSMSPWSTFANPMTQTTVSPWSSLASPMGQSTLSPWSGYSSPTTLSPWSSFPSSYGSQFASQWPGQHGFSAPYHQQPYSAQQTPYSGKLPTCPDTRGTDSLQPDLTGFWRGSGGESVEVQRNYARIWGGEDKPCNCVFFLVGQRLIAYSPDTDVVRKYWYQSGGSNQFTLIDESGNRMTYQRTR